MTDGPPIDELKAIAHPLRFAILETLKSGERNVGEIEQASGIAQPALSQQLGVLRRAGLVDTRREAKLVYYSVSAESLGRLAQSIAAFRPADTDADATEGTRALFTGAANFARIY
ncbi:ArsR/SmtB family transcription factor [Qipengyuania zhejiangensis]|uniref:ArsR/SmtB family transcription factor n=1 Tax=Qipengyuania zhejiangensis TaxID=3077782 RepID=UPI002D76ABAC|nr:metalloregulator ArsR/SmtB family transcription factor [Qipengyuania sp. Z2]